MSTTNSLCVFVGTPSSLSPSQEPVLHEWLDWLAARAVHVRRLEPHMYGDDPWAQLIALLTEVDGAVLLGFPQQNADESPWPTGRDETGATRARTSSWLQVEAGMVIALGLPLLVAADAGVDDGGVRSQGMGGQRQRDAATYTRRGPRRMVCRPYVRAVGSPAWMPSDLRPGRQLRDWDPGCRDVEGLFGNRPCDERGPAGYVDRSSPNAKRSGGRSQAGVS